MNAFVMELQQRWSAMESREQRALMGLSVFMLVVVFYLAIWVPVHDYADSARSNFDRHQTLYQYLKATEAEARSSASSPGATRPSGQSLLSVVSSVARSVSINPSRLQPEGGDSVSVWFEGVAFSQLMQWLEKLEYERGITVKQLSIEKRDQPGQVSARLVLQ